MTTQKDMQLSGTADFHEITVHMFKHVHQHYAFVNVEAVVGDYFVWKFVLFDECSNKVVRVIFLYIQFLFSRYISMPGRVVLRVHKRPLCEVRSKQSFTKCCRRLMQER